MAQCVVKNYCHNSLVLDSLEEGDLISIKENILFSHNHWAVYAGDDMVVHLSGKNDVSSEFAFVKLENFWKVVGNSKAKKNNKKDNKRTPFRGEDIVERALSRIGPNAYNVLWNNCEHFASWCRYDKKRSAQVDKALTVASIVGGIVVVGGLLHEIFKIFQDDD
ncbi:phospholipase A and acyltransferase 2-like [Mytilus edulis]|uniref:phospholipase A and acyltransferase 2-like n=1 Tax=Mytilus edulis TaxID=6550 RepID=UPI0039F03839